MKSSNVTNRIRSFDAPEIPEPVQSAMEAARNASSSLFNELRTRASDVYEESTTSQISSLVDKYKGPDSLSRPEIELEVDKYKGPKQLFDQRGSRVEKYKGPDDAQRQIFIMPELDTDAIQAVINARRNFLMRNANENK